MSDSVDTLRDTRGPLLNSSPPGSSGKGNPESDRSGSPRKGWRNGGSYADLGSIMRLLSSRIPVQVWVKEVKFSKETEEVDSLLFTRIKPEPDS